MNSILMVATLTCSAILVALWALLRKSAVGGQTLCRRRKRLAGRSGTPIEKRLTLDDFKFLIAHPAVNRVFLRELRRERRKVLRHYIRRLRRDFDQVCAEIKMLMTQSCHDRPDLAAVLLKMRLSFTTEVIRAEFAMISEAAGLTTVDFDQVVGALESIRLNVDHLFLVLQPGPR